MERYVRIAFESVYDYIDKDNRNQNPDLTLSELTTLNEICNKINQISSIDQLKSELVRLVETIENRLIQKL